MAQPSALALILATLTDTCMRVLEPISEKLHIDQLMVHEDFAGKSGPLIGPKHIKEHFEPYYRKVWDLLASRGARIFEQDTDGNINPVGPRAVYDEAKRYAEALIAAYVREGLNGGIIRIFNTYGPRMRTDDGRVVTQFISQALEGAPLTVYGDGSQTRSLCYVSDLVRGFVAMIDGTYFGPVNLGNPHELTVREIAELVRDLVGSDSPIDFSELPEDDPKRRRPDIARAQAELGWSPEVDVVDGLSKTVDWIRCVGLDADLRTAV